MNNTLIKRCYVCSPCRAESHEAVQQNMLNARRYVEWVEGIADGVKRRAYALHGYLPPLLDDADLFDRTLAMDFCAETLHFCTEVYVFGHKLSDGMKMEIEQAVSYGMPIHVVDTLVGELEKYWHEKGITYRNYDTFTYDEVTV